MFARTKKTLTVLLVALVTVGVSQASATATGASRDATSVTNDVQRAASTINAGPPYNFLTELIRYDVVPLKNLAVLAKTKLGYRFRTGQQDSHLVVTRVDGGLRFADRGTRSFKKLAPSCKRLKVDRGIAAVCRVPGDISVRRPLLIEVWPRLGDDFTDTSTLPATFAVSVLSDKGHDVAYLGAGPDFFNGFSGRDRVWGGAGNDWLRGGLQNDTLRGGPGNDDIVAFTGHDKVIGGQGDDRVGGGDGDDRIWGNTGADFVLCGTGRDRANVDATDRIFNDCESRYFS